MKNNILYLTGSRADYGRMKPLLKKLDKNNNINLHLLITGMHLMQEFGMTINHIKKEFNKFTVIENKGFFIDNHKTMNSLVSNTSEKVSAYLLKNKIDKIIIFGDRVEMLGLAIAGIIHNIKIIHIGGGDLSGGIDNKIRKAISMMSDQHYVSCEEHKKRLINYGISESKITNTGSADVFSLTQAKYKKVEYLKDKYKINFLDKKYCILIYHPVTDLKYDINFEITEIINTLISEKTNCIVIYPNSDLGSSNIYKNYNKLRNNSNFALFKNLDYLDFISLLKNSEFIIGNSSAGIIESSYLCTPSINIIGRQRNRTKGKNVIDCDPKMENIKKAIEIINTKKFRDEIIKTKNIYGDQTFIDKIWSDLNA